MEQRGTATLGGVKPKPSIYINSAHTRQPIMAPQHGWLTSPARSQASSGAGKELPLHLITLILSHLDSVADLARVTRSSRLFYYMTLPRLYEKVTLRSYSEIRYVNGKPEGYGSGSPFAMGLNTLVSRTFTDYVHSFRVVGEWSEHDTDAYNKGRVPDNSMVLQVVMRAALDKMKNLHAFHWELNTKPLQTVYQGIMGKPALTSLTLRCPTTRIPRPTTLIPPLPNLQTLVVYNMDPLCYPDDISLLLATSTRLENLMMHWSPRMRESGEESVNLMNYFGRAYAAQRSLPMKRFAIYNLYTRNQGEGMDDTLDTSKFEELTVINSMGTSDPITVFLDDTWRLNSSRKIPTNLKSFRGDVIDKELVQMLSQFKGLERLYLLDRVRSSKPSSTTTTPSTPSTNTPSCMASGATGTPVTEYQCKSLAGDYLAVIESNHRTMRHLLLSDQWQLSDDTLFRLCQMCPNLEQLGFSTAVPPLRSFRQILHMIPKLWALRFLVRPGSDLDEKLNNAEDDMHVFALATELWRPEYANLRYVGLGDNMIWKCGEIIYPSKKPPMTPGQENSMNSRRHGPMRRLIKMDRESVKHIEIWGLDSLEFDPSFP